MSFGTVSSLKKQITQSLRAQGFSVRAGGNIELRGNGREAFRNAHLRAKAERLASRQEFISKFAPIAYSCIPDGSDIDPARIEPMLVEVSPDTEEEEFYRWWNLVWWSLPYEHAYGRQMRYLVWDNYHHALIGLIGLQSPILSWSVRDQHLGITAAQRDLWVNQSLSAQRLGAVPPYNYLLGGKLVAMLMASDGIRQRFYRKYHNVKTIMSERTIPARLLFLTTTGAYGKSSVYQRLKYQGEPVAEFIGYSHGSGSFHISDALFEDLLKYLERRGMDTARGYGNGPSRKLRLIDNAMEMLGYSSGAEHGITRAVYLFPLAKNLKEVIATGKRPEWYSRPTDKLAAFWRDRWAVPRSLRDDTYKKFTAKHFMRTAMTDLDSICSMIIPR